MYRGGAETYIHKKVRKLGESRDFTQHLVHQLVQSPTFTASVPCMVKQRAEIAAIRDAKIRAHSTKQDLAEDQNNSPSLPTVRYEDSSMPFQDDEKVIRKYACIHQEAFL